MNQLILTFTALSIVNVVFSTIRSIVTIKGNKFAASLISGAYYSFYNVMVVYTVADFPMWQKCSITFICNLIGVFIVKWGEEKARKDKLWKIEATVYGSQEAALAERLKEIYLPYNYIANLGKYTIFNIYCETQEDSRKARSLLSEFNAKYFISENKG